MKLRILTLAMVAAVLTMFSPLAALASSAALYVSPASGTVAVGSIIPVQVRVNTGGDPVNAVQANLSYNASQLAYEKYDDAGSAFSLNANVQTGSGSLKMARSLSGGEAPVSGDILFVTVYFKALTTTGTASVAIASDSHVVRSTDSVDIMAGAPAATGTKASATGAPKPIVYASLSQAQAAVTAAATPKPSTAAGASAPPTSSGATNSDTATPAPNSVKVLAWNSPLALGGIAVLIGLIALVMYVILHRRQIATPATSVAGPTIPTGPTIQAAPLGSVDEHGIISPTTVYPTHESTNDSDQIER